MRDTKNVRKYETMGNVPQIIVKRPVFTRNVNKNEIDFVIETTVNSPICDEIASEINFQFCSG